MLHTSLAYSSLIISLCILSVFSQSLQSRHYRPLTDNKCERRGRCSPKEGYIEETPHDEDFKSVQDRPSVLTRDDWPKRPNEDDYKSKVDIDKDDSLKPSRPSGGAGFGGGYNSKPAAHDEKVSDRDKDESVGYDEKTLDESNDNLKPVNGGGRPSSSSGGYGGGYSSKPLNRDEDLKPSGGSRPSTDRGYGGGYNPKPTVDDDLKPARPAGIGSGAYGGGYLPKPSDSVDDLKPVRGRPGGAYGSSYIPKPDDVYGGRPGGESSYNRKPLDRDFDVKPSDDRDEYDVKPKDDNVRDRYGGGYNPKPVPSRGEYPKLDDEDYNIKPSRGAGGYYPDDDRKPTKEDLGGYNQPKDVSYNDDYTDYDFDESSKPHRMKDGKCICVPYYQCRDGHIVTDGAGIIDARKRPEPVDELPLDGKFNPPSCGPFHVCCNTPETSTVKPYEHRCGVRNPSGINSRILSPSNKGEADFGEWPWQAAVLKAEGKVNIFQCGGVLIDKYHVITVAHCVFHLYQYNEYPLKVRLGEWDTQTTTEFLAHEDYRVAKIIVHPEYKNTSLWNDIAVLRLQDPVLFAPHIDTVCLPQYDEIFSGQNCVVTGWGKDAYKGGTFSNVMKEVALQVIDNYQCEEMLRKTRLGRFFQLHEGFLCAGGEYGLDSCKGDGGGPLVCYRKDKSYALAGIVSWGIDCGQPGVPGVYVKIQKYLDWISKTTGMSLQEYWPK